MAVSDVYHWRGLLTKAPDGSLTCTLKDSNNVFSMQLRATKVEGGYWVIGTPDPNPVDYWVRDTDGELR